MNKTTVDMFFSIYKARGAEHTEACLNALKIFYLLLSCFFLSHATHVVGTCTLIYIPEHRCSTVLLVGLSV